MINYSKKKKYNVKNISFLVILLIIFGCFFLNRKEKIYFPKVEDTPVILKEYFSHGQFLNLKLEINEDLTNAEKISLVLKNKKSEYEIYEFQNKSFSILSTGEVINEGIFLDDFKIGEYFTLVKVEKKVEDKIVPFYYKIQNGTAYDNLEYYTIKNKDGVRKITLYFKTITKDEGIITHMMTTVKKSSDENIYDIAIDPGHGAPDSGTEDKFWGTNEVESTNVLKIGLLLKKKLESIGLKVFITRDDDYFPGHYECANTNLRCQDPYGEQGRVTQVHNSYAKYSFDIHVNNTDYLMDYGGVEVYNSIKRNNNFAKLIADKIVEVVNTTHSRKGHFKTLDPGVYKWYLTQDEVNKTAMSNGYEPYQLKGGQVDYLYAIRETGGISTEAYMDGRNLEYRKNLAYNSNRGVETYLIELGYFSYKPDFEKLTTNHELYAEAIFQAIKEYLQK